MNNYKCEDCNQGRACDCPPMIALPAGWKFTPAAEIEEPTVWDHIWNYTVSLLAAIGLLSVALGIGLYLGGFFGFLLKVIPK